MLMFLAIVWFALKRWHRSQLPVSFSFTKHQANTSAASQINHDLRSPIPHVAASFIPLQTLKTRPALLSCCTAAPSASARAATVINCFPPKTNRPHPAAAHGEPQMGAILADTVAPGAPRCAQRMQCDMRKAQTPVGALDASPRLTSPRT